MRQTHYVCDRRGIVQSAVSLVEASHAMWVLLAHELRNGRDTSYHIETHDGTRIVAVEPLPPNLHRQLSWVLDTLRAHGRLK